MDYFEQSRDETLCDKWISYLNSCRECLFNVLCGLDKQWQTLFFNKHNNDNRQK